MTKKELYKLSVTISGKALAGFFGAPASNFENMEMNSGRKLARKKVYEELIKVITPTDQG